MADKRELDRTAADRAERRTDAGLARAASDRAELEAITEQLRAHGLAVPQPTAATYDTTTEGRTGWRFILAPRWIAYIAAAILFVASCVLGVFWQASQWTQINAANAIVLANYRAAGAPLADVLPTTTSYRGAIQWRMVIATGTYDTAQQLFVRDRSCVHIDAGFEVLTPLRLADGSRFIVDRGCVAARATNQNLPAAPAAPPSGPVTVTARVVASETNQGAVAGDQVESIDLHQVANTIGGTVYTGAYGMLVAQSPSAAKSLAPVISGRPLLDTTTQTVTIFATVLYVLVGLFIFIFALRQQFRWVNRFSPALWMRELRRIQRAAGKAYTDEELEDHQVRRDAAGPPVYRAPAPAPEPHVETDVDPGSARPPEDGETKDGETKDGETKDGEAPDGVIVDDGSFQWTDDEA